MTNQSFLIIWWKYHIDNNNKYVSTGFPFLSSRNMVIDYEYFGFPCTYLCQYVNTIILFISCWRLAYHTLPSAITSIIFNQYILYVSDIYNSLKIKIASKRKLKWIYYSWKKNQNEQFIFFLNIDLKLLQSFKIIQNLQRKREKENISSIIPWQKVQYLVKNQTSKGEKSSCFLNIIFFVWEMFHISWANIKVDLWTKIRRKILLRVFNGNFNLD